MRSTLLAITVSMLAVTAHGQGLSDRVTTLESEHITQDERLEALEAI